MSVRIKNVSINIEKTINHKIRNFEKENNVLKYLKKNIKSEFNAIEIYNEDVDLIKNISNMLGKDSFYISYFSSLTDAVKARTAINKKNVLIINSDFINNDLRSAIADIMIIKDILLNYENYDLFKELNRVLKSDGIILFKENITIEKIKTAAANAIVKKSENYFTSGIKIFLDKLRLIKNIEYSIYITGISDFIYIGKGNLNKLYDFCDFLFDKSKKKDFALKEFRIILLGIRGFKK